MSKPIEFKHHLVQNYEPLLEIMTDMYSPDQLREMFIQILIKHSRLAFLDLGMSGASEEKASEYDNHVFLLKEFIDALKKIEVSAVLEKE